MNYIDFWGAEDTPRRLVSVEGNLEGSTTDGSLTDLDIIFFFCIFILCCETLKSKSVRQCFGYKCHSDVRGGGVRVCTDVRKG